MKRRVFVTGLGIIAPNGMGKDRFWEALLQGRSAIDSITHFETKDYKVKIGAEVRHFHPQDHLKADEVSRYGRQAQLALAAARMALEDAKLFARPHSAMRVGVCLGNLYGEPMLLREAVAAWEGMGNPSSTRDLFTYPHGSLSAVLSEELRLEGPSLTVYCTCASGNYAIAHGSSLIRQGKIDAMLVGGADIISWGIFSSFYHWRALSPDRCQPFDRNRKGLVLGEGAGMLVLQAEESVREPESKIYCEVLGCGLASDAFHLSAPHPQGDGMVRAMEHALEEAQLPPAAVDHINAHGTGTVANDVVETQAIKRVFGSHSYRIPISAIKSMIGHAMGAASAIEAIACVLAILHQTVPPTISLETPDPACDLDYVPNQARSWPVRVAMNDALGFGGINAAILFGQWSPVRREER